MASNTRNHPEGETPMPGPRELPPFREEGCLGVFLLFLFVAGAAIATVAELIA